MNELKYFIYCRKSSESKDRQALSIEAQRRELLEFAEKNNLKIVEVFEESQSAYKLGRPIFKKMMDLCKEGIANGILAWKTDRLARNAEDGGKVIQALDDKILLEIRTPYEVFRQEDNRMMLYVLFGMSNDFSRQISANVKRGNRQKYARGEFLGRGPVGYLNAKIGNSRNIIPDPEKAPIIKKLFETYAKGDMLVLQLREYGDKLGLTSISGRKILKSEIYRLLKCPVYYGVYKHGNEFHQGSYEPLISKRLFDEVQDVLSNRSKPRKQSWIHAYKGLIKCAGCGCGITAETKEKFYKRTNRNASYTYYRCTRRRGRCLEPGVTDKELEKMLTANISQISIDKETWELGIKLLKAKNASEFEFHHKIKEQHQAELKKVDRNLELLLDLRISEEITSEEYAVRKKDFITKRLEIKEKLLDRDETTENWLELAEQFFDTAYSAKEIMENGKLEEKRELVKAIGWNLFLRDKNLEFSFKKPYDVLLRPEIRKSWQGRTDSNCEKQFWRLL